MENRQTGVLRLFIILGFFSVSIFFLNNNKKNILIATHIDLSNFKIDNMGHLSLDQMYESMSSLFLAHDTELIIKVISQFKYRFAYDFVEKMITDNDICLSCEEKIYIIYGLIARCGEKKAEQYDFFDLVIKYPILYAKTPLLLLLARGKYADMIALFIAWGKDRQKNTPPHNLLSHCIDEALTAAIKDNDSMSVEMLFSKKIRLSPIKACSLLWYVIEHEKNSDLISLLVHHAQADVNYVSNGKTPLIAAVEKNNIQIVRTLLDEGAVVDRFLDGEYETALHIAIKYKYSSVELLLREYGAA
ncbi:MAG TPA: ankyrin repeat domain-containing protein [Candidatus Babeliales bacterium]|nr:ankyrin repeat domain-containing protein [Candidatus Babeliales bacterium]